MTDKLLKLLAMLLPPERCKALLFALLDQAKLLAARTDNDLDDTFLDLVTAALHKVLDTSPGGA